MKWIVLLACIFNCAISHSSEVVKIGSKKFTESVILAEAGRQMIEAAGLATVHRAELGSTRVLWNALRAGEIDVYPEYTGTIIEELLPGTSPDPAALKSALNAIGLGMTRSLGFNNTYALGMKARRAEELAIRRISDLRGHPDLKFGFSDEFKTRKDGWPLLRQRYQLPQSYVRGMDHAVSYRALEGGDIDVVDLYSTDAEIGYYQLLALEDDLAVFPRYDAVFLYRVDLEKRAPMAAQQLKRFEGMISERQMVDLNARAKIGKTREGEVAREFLLARFGVATKTDELNRTQRIIARLKEHLLLVGVSMLAAIMIAVPLGVVAAKVPVLGQWIITLAGIIQTIPALALLVLLIQPLKSLGLSGIGDTPAIVALLLYSLLPIVRNTHVGITNIAQPLRESAEALGLGAWSRLWLIELPLARPYVLAGIKTAAVINVGFATLGALIGAGGFGQPILAGIRLDDYRMILEGAVPAALLALTVQGAFELLEGRVRTHQFKL